MYWQQPRRSVRGTGSQVAEPWSMPFTHVSSCCCYISSRGDTPPGRLPARGGPAKMRPPSEGPSASKVVQSAATTAGETSWGRKQRDRASGVFASTGREPAPAWRPSPRIASLRAEGAGDALAGAFEIAQAAGSWPCTGRADSPRPPRAAIRWSIPPDGPDLAPPRSPPRPPPSPSAPLPPRRPLLPASRSAPRPRPPKRRLPLAAPRAPRDRRGRLAPARLPALSGGAPPSPAAHPRPASSPARAHGPAHRRSPRPAIPRRAPRRHPPRPR